MLHKYDFELKLKIRKSSDFQNSRCWTYLVTIISLTRNGTSLLSNEFNSEVLDEQIISTQYVHNDIAFLFPQN